MSQQFEFGIAMRNGVPIGPVTDLQSQLVTVADDREGGFDLDDCIEREAYVWVPCNAMALEECNIYLTIIYYECDPSPGGSGGGYGNGTTTGGGGGGGGLVLTTEEQQQWNFIKYLIETGQLNFYGAFHLGVPVHIFVYYGGQIPPGLDVQEYTQLVQLHELCQFNEAQFNWVSQHASLIPYMTTLLAQHGNAPAWIDALKDVIDARIGGTNLFSWANMAKLVELQVVVGFNIDALKWIIEYSTPQQAQTVIDQISSFVLNNIDNVENINAIKLHVELLMQPNSEYFISNYQSNFPDFGTLEWAENINFSVEALPRTTLEEKLLACLYPWDALVIFDNRHIARQKQKAFWGNDINVTWLGKGDAFLHTYYQAINTQDVGAIRTLQFSTAHESESPAILHLEKEMDLYNNQIGIATGLEFPNLDRHLMADAVHQKVLDGLCKYLHPVDHTLSPPFDGDCIHCLNGILPNTILKWTNE